MIFLKISDFFEGAGKPQHRLGYECDEKKDEEERDEPGRTGPDGILEGDTGNAR
jgi:hypothetical protein